MPRPNPLCRTGSNTPQTDRPSPTLSDPCLASRQSSLLSIPQPPIPNGHWWASTLPTIARCVVWRATPAQKWNDTGPNFLPAGNCVRELASREAQCQAAGGRTRSLNRQPVGQMPQSSREAKLAGVATSTFGYCNLPWRRVQRDRANGRSCGSTGHRRSRRITAPLLRRAPLAKSRGRCHGKRRSLETGNPSHDGFPVLVLSDGSDPIAVSPDASLPPTQTQVIRAPDQFHSEPQRDAHLERQSSVLRTRRSAQDSP